MSGATPTTAGTAKSSRLLELDKQMPRLKESNFVAWNEALLNLQYYANWDVKLIDIEQSSTTKWDGVDETDKVQANDRRLAYAVIRMSISPELYHLRDGMRPGDVMGLYKKLYTRFCRLTHGAIAGLKKDINSFPGGNLLQVLC